MVNDRGIVILSLQHSIYYGYARNLVATIRAFDPSISITVFSDNTDMLMESWLNVDVKELDIKYYTNNGQIQPFRAKLQLPEFSPYKNTLYLDADMAWLYIQTSKIFDELKGNQFAIANNGKVNTCIWANANAIKQAYGDADLYHLFSEIIYFEKSPEIKKFFKLALASYDNPKVSTIPFAGAKTSDEFAFITAIMQNGIRPHKDEWKPIFWYHRDKKQMAAHPQVLNQNYFGYSLGGNQLPEFVKKNYNIIVAAAFSRLGLQYPTSAQDKRRIIPERKNI